MVTPSGSVMAMLGTAEELLDGEQLAADMLAVVDSLRMRLVSTLQPALRPMIANAANAQALGAQIIVAVQDAASLLHEHGISETVRQPQLAAQLVDSLLHTGQSLSQLQQVCDPAMGEVCTTLAQPAMQRVQHAVQWVQSQIPASAVLSRGLRMARVVMQLANAAHDTAGAVQQLLGDGVSDSALQSVARKLADIASQLHRLPVDKARVLSALQKISAPGLPDGLASAARLCARELGQQQLRKALHLPTNLTAGSGFAVSLDDSRDGLAAALENLGQLLPAASTARAWADAHALLEAACSGSSRVGLGAMTCSAVLPIAGQQAQLVKVQRLVGVAIEKAKLIRQAGAHVKAVADAPPHTAGEVMTTTAQHVIPAVQAILMAADAEPQGKIFGFAQRAHELTVSATPHAGSLDAVPDGVLTVRRILRGHGLGSGAVQAAKKLLLHEMCSGDWARRLWPAAVLPAPCECPPGWTPRAPGACLLVADQSSGSSDAASVCAQLNAAPAVASEAVLPAMLRLCEQVSGAEHSACCVASASDGEPGEEGVCYGVSIEEQAVQSVSCEKARPQICAMAVGSPTCRAGAALADTLAEANADAAAAREQLDSGSLLSGRVPQADMPLPTGELVKPVAVPAADSCTMESAAAAAARAFATGLNHTCGIDLTSAAALLRPLAAAGDGMHAAAVLSTADMLQLLNIHVNSSAMTCAMDLMPFAGLLELSVDLHVALEKLTTSGGLLLDAGFALNVYLRDEWSADWSPCKPGNDSACAFGQGFDMNMDLSMQLPRLSLQLQGKPFGDLLPQLKGWRAVLDAMRLRWHGGALQLAPDANLYLTLCGGAASICSKPQGALGLVKGLAMAGARFMVAWSSLALSLPPLALERIKRTELGAFALWFADELSWDIQLGPARAVWPAMLQTSKLVHGMTKVFDFTKFSGLNALQSVQLGVRRLGSFMQLLLEPLRGTSGYLSKLPGISWARAGCAGLQERAAQNASLLTDGVLQALCRPSSLDMLLSWLSKLRLPSVSGGVGDFTVADLAGMGLDFGVDPGLDPSSPVQLDFGGSFNFDWR